MSIMIACMRCGGPIEVDDETLAQFAKVGQPVQSQHEQCPTDEKPNVYRAVIAVEKNGERIASVGSTVEGASFEDIFTSLSKEVSRQWEQIGQHATVADADPSNSGA